MMVNFQFGFCKKKQFLKLQEFFKLYLFWGKKKNIGKFGFYFKMNKIFLFFNISVRGIKIYVILEGLYLEIS